MSTGLRHGGGYISIHAPHEGERRLVLCLTAKYRIISIHAPHEGERRVAQIGVGTHFVISIHAPHEGERRALFSPKKSC